MSNDPVDDLLEGMSDAASTLDGVERHLDAFPLPVDEQALDAAVDRLERRLGRPSRSRSWPVIGALMAASFLVGVVLPRLIAPTPPAASTVSDETASAIPVHQLVAPAGALQLPVDVALDLVEPSAIVTTGDADLAVTLVQEGTIRIGPDTLVPEGHWVITTPTTEPVIFADGTVPPTLNPDVWPTDRIDAQLRAARVDALDDTTRAALAAILEKNR